MSTPTGGHDHVEGASASERQQRTIPPVRAPLGLVLLGAVVIGILGLIYVHEVVGLTAANDELHTLQAEQRQLERQDGQLHAQLGEVTSPEYVDRRARELGLRPNDPSTPVTVIVVPGSTAGGR